MTATDSYNRARADLTPSSDPTLGPPRWYYYSDQVSLIHEEAHRDDFYENYWNSAMMDFEQYDVEGSGAAVIFNCLTSTTIRSVVESQKNQALIADRTGRHNGAVALRNQDIANGTSETRAHQISNPEYQSIYNQVP